MCEHLDLICIRPYTNFWDNPLEIEQVQALQRWTENKDEIVAVAKSHEKYNKVTILGSVPI